MDVFGILASREVRDATKTARERVVEEVRRTIRRHGMISDGDLVVIAVSGGPDSICLLHVLAGLRDELGFSSRVAHLDHQMRAQSPHDVELVKKCAASFDIPCSVGRADVFGIAKTRRVGLEEAGRIARYDLYRQVKKELVGAGRSAESVKIAVGHNQNDQAETVLMHLMRGSGTDGLAGIPPINGDIIRPLLDVPRELIEEYCREQGLATMTDTYNLDLAYTRNRLRYKTLPQLSREYNPSLSGTLAATAAVLRWDSDYMGEQASEAFSHISRKEGRVTTIRADLLGTLPPALSSRLIQEAWKECSGRPYSSGTGLANVVRILDLIASGDGGGSAPKCEGVDEPGASCSRRWSLTLPDNVSVHYEGAKKGREDASGTAGGWGGSLRFVPSARPLNVDIELTGLWYTEVRAVYVPELGLSLELRLLSGEEAEQVKCRVLSQRTPGHANYEFFVEPVAYLDYNQIKGSLRLRARRRGDRFSPLGMYGREQKLQDFFVSRRIPRFIRDLVPILTDDDDIVWVGGHRLSEKYKLGSGAGPVLKAEIRPDLRRSGTYVKI